MTLRVPYMPVDAIERDAEALLSEYAHARGVEIKAPIPIEDIRLPNSVFKPYASIGTNLLFFEKGEPTKDIWFWEHRVPQGQKAYSMTKPIRFKHLQGCIDWWGGGKRKGREEGQFAWKVTAEEVKARGYNLDIKNPHTIADDHGEPDELLAKLTAAEAETAGLRDQLKGTLAEALAR